MKEHLNNISWTLISFCLFATTWQACEPPPLPDCTNDSLFSTSASITHSAGNNNLIIRVTPPTTCSNDVLYPIACNYASLDLYIDFKDCYENIMATADQQIKFNNDLSSSQGLSWSLDSTGGIVLGDGSVSFALTTSPFAAPLKSIDIRIYSNIVNDSACGQSPSGDLSFILSSFNFYNLENSWSPPATPLLTDQLFQNSQYLSFANILVTQEDCK